MIKLKNIKEKPCIFCHENAGELFEVVDYINFLDCLVQVREEGKYGYYIMFEGKKIRIDKNGTLEFEPNDLFGQSLNLLCKLI